jgi:hypothetical protein
MSAIDRIAFVHAEDANNAAWAAELAGVPLTWLEDKQ